MRERRVSAAPRGRFAARQNRRPALSPDLWRRCGEDLDGLPGSSRVIDRLSAIKSFAPARANAELCERFLREARAVNRINHDNIVEISDYGEANGVVYLVMEYVPGETMRRHMSAGLMGWPRAANIGIQIASALGRAHQMGLVHSDVNPSSILLVKRKDRTEAVKLIDFGAKISPNPKRRSKTARRCRGLVTQPRNHADRSLRCAIRSVRTRGGALRGHLRGEPLGGHQPWAPGRRFFARADLDERVPHLPKDSPRVVMQLLSPRPELRQRDAFVLLDELTAIVADHADSAPVISQKAPLSQPRLSVDASLELPRHLARRRTSVAPLVGHQRPQGARGARFDPFCS